jgi:hypothetical protein
MSLSFPQRAESWESGDIYEQAVVKTVAGFFRGNSTHLFGVTRFGAPEVYVRAGSSHHNEVVWPHHTQLGAEISKMSPQLRGCVHDVG